MNDPESFESSSDDGLETVADNLGGIDEELKKFERGLEEQVLVAFEDCGSGGDPVQDDELAGEADDGNDDPQVIAAGKAADRAEHIAAEESPVLAEQVA